MSDEKHNFVFQEEHHKAIWGLNISGECQQMLHFLLSEAQPG